MLVVQLFRLKVTTSSALGDINGDDGTGITSLTSYAGGGGGGGGGLGFDIGRNYGGTRGKGSPGFVMVVWNYTIVTSN